MTEELFFSAVTLLVLATLTVLGRKSVAAIFTGSTAVLVVALPWLRLFLAQLETNNAKEPLLSYLAIVCFSLGAFVAGRWSPSTGAVSLQWMRHEQSRGPERITWIIAIVTFAVVWVLRLYRGVNYGILFSGSGDEEAVSGQSYLFVVVNSLVEMSAVASYVYLCMFRNQSRRVAWPLILLELSWALIAGGRRNLIFDAGILTLALVATQDRLKIRHLVGLSLAAYVFTAVISPMFVLARMNILSYLPQTDAFTSISLGIHDVIFDYNQYSALSSQLLKENLDERGDVRKFLGTVIEEVDLGGQKMHGDAMLNALAWVIPSSVLKKPVYMVEQEIQNFLGLPMADDAISWPTVAYVDFGLAGCFIYGMIFIGLLNSIIALAKRSNNKVLLLAGSFQAAFIAFNTEADPLLLFAAMRDFSILYLSFTLIQWRLSTQQARRPSETA